MSRWYIFVPPAGTILLRRLYEQGGKRGRGTENKEIVAIAVEIHSPKGFGRVRMQRIPDVSGISLVPFVRGAVESDSEILTDGWRGYNDLPKHSYKHSKTVLSETGDPAHVAMPGVHRIASLLKRWLLCTHQGAVSGKHLDYYLDASVKSRFGCDMKS